MDDHPALQTAGRDTLAEPVLRFHGAARAVTGSCYELEADGRRILIDCGLFQGSKAEKELNYRDFPFDPKGIDAVLLTHAHIDHSGLLPKLTKAGFAGPIFASRATEDLCTVMLPDSAYIQDTEVAHLNRRNKRRGRRTVVPIYDGADVVNCLKQFAPVALGDWFTVTGGIRARYWNAGHLLGSASIELECPAPGERPRRLLFSGDIGPEHKLLQADPSAPSGFDYVICESTYGDRDREGASEADRRLLLREAVEAALDPDGALLIPSFAVERTQELLVDLQILIESGDLPAVPIIIDSPLATRAAGVFARHARELDHGEILSRALTSPNIRFTESAEESKALDRLKGFHIVIAASGMCEAGRIRHRLRNWLWRPQATVLFVGFQAQGTLGRILRDGASTVRIQGDEVIVRAKIRAIDLYSGHADGPELREWLSERCPVAAGVFLVHGEVEAIDALKARLAGVVAQERIVIPQLDAAFRLTARSAVPVASEPVSRIDPAQPGHLDWHNEVSRLLLDINERLENAAGDKARGVMIRKLRRAMSDAD
ncbi:MBL fold metallo-hydrolase [Aurantimonas coralicida]|uniref:MBL fold metallo-hydrolase n=1 Tax=Aurantimonas coralicida TaxID=182270 RepID=UPI001D18181E|nr:MBL fold metallo-hydrolase [Aurantimonas coralicida]MCC4298743.1 MBL fold metallo-hydrolase [Aurantimonas coralicida]